MRWLLIILAFALWISPLFCEEKVIIRVGHFPNLTHAQGLIGHYLTRQNKGWFEKWLGENVEVQWFVYTTGPGAMEGILIDSLDLTYVGPTPTINAYLKSKGEEVRILCGACSGGSALLVQPDGRIKKAADFRGKKIGTPGLGNTQDVAARVWLQSLGLRITLTGGDAFVIPVSTADQLALFKSRDLDAVWTIEPWVSELMRKANAKIFLKESSLWPETDGMYLTTLLASSKKFLKTHPELAKKWVSAHVALTNWIQKNSDAARRMVNKEIEQETRMKISEEMLRQAWRNLTFIYKPLELSLYRYANDAYKIGFLKEKPDLKQIYDLRFLEKIHDR